MARRAVLDLVRLGSYSVDKCLSYDQTSRREMELAMRLINFSHPLTEEQIAQLGASLGEQYDLVHVPTQFDPLAPFADQVADLVDGVGLSSKTWQTERLVINPPTYAPIAAVLLAELHGRMGYFPPIVRLRAVPDAMPPRFEMAEVIDLGAVRERARKRR